jgi:hypothetical protein
MKVRQAFDGGITVKDRFVSRDDGFFLLPTGNTIACCGCFNENPHASQTRATRHWLFTKYKIEKAVNFDLWSFLLMFISSYITRYGI